VKVIVKCHLGNGLGYRDGVNTTADSFYKRYIASFGEAEITQFLRLFSDQDFTIDFDSTKPHRRAMALATAFKAKTRNVHIVKALDAVLAQPEGALRKISLVAKFREAVANIPKQV